MSEQEIINQSLDRPAKGKSALRIWRYEVPPTIKLGMDAGFVVRMPAGAQLLHVQRGQSSAEIFALVNPENPEEERLFYAAKTNFPLPDPQPEYKAMWYVGSWFGYGQSWHLFEVERWPREPGQEG